MRYLYLLVLCLGTFAQVVAQETFGDDVKPKAELGINLMPSAAGDLYHFAVITRIGESVFYNPHTTKYESTPQYEYKLVGRMEFIEMALGRMECEANPQKINMFRQFEIDTMNQYWDPIENLWRLRYSGHPFYPNDNSGWFMPNPDYMYTDVELNRYDFLAGKRDSMKVIYNNQQRMLASFGITKFSEYIKGDNLFKLLKAMQDVKWVENFVQAPLPDDVLVPLTKKEPAPLTEAQKLAQKTGQKPRYDTSTITISNVTNAWEQLTEGPKTDKKKK